MYLILLYACNSRDASAGETLRAVVLEGERALMQSYTPAMLAPPPPLYTTPDEVTNAPSPYHRHLSTLHQMR